jgi:O-antigen ligase
VVWCALVGHAGVAILNLTRVAGASLRGGEFPASLPGLLLNVREYTQYDVNAAGSILVLVILAAAGLASRRARLPLILTIGVVTIGLWVAGSRVARAALLMAITGVLALRSRRSTRTLWVAGAAVLVSAGAIGWLVLGYPAGRNLNLPTSIASRAVLFKAALGMTADAPVLGIGTGTFLEESPNYGAEALAPLVFDGRTRDNAHNYFLQTLAEQGVVGLLALITMLAAALVPALRTMLRRGNDGLLTWVAAGVGASILTWMTGHPLLLTEAALMFWLFVGVLAGLSEPPAASPALRRIVGVGAVVMLASIPFRGVAGERAANLDHRALGVSQWQPAVDGERYREAGAEFSLYLPSGALTVLPLRSAAGSAVTIELRIDARPINAVVAPADMWRQFRIQVPESESRYVKVDFRLIGSPPSCQGCVWVGKALPLAR